MPCYPPASDSLCVAAISGMHRCNEKCRQPREAVGTRSIKLAAAPNTRRHPVTATGGTASEDVIRAPRPPRHPAPLAPRGVRIPAGGVALSMYVHYHGCAGLSRGAAPHTQEIAPWF